MEDTKADEDITLPDYWNKYYGKLKSKEWHGSFAELRPFFEPHLPNPIDEGKTPRILHLGCGISSLPIDLWEIGYKDQVCVDFSGDAINRMAERYREKDGVEWKVADIRDLNDLQDESFDVAIDKGALDSLLDGHPANPSDDMRENARLYTDEVVRTLKRDGVFFCITYYEQSLIMPHLVREGIWELEAVGEIREPGGPFYPTGYVMKIRNRK